MARETLEQRLKKYATMTIHEAVEIIDHAGDMSYSDLAHACAAQKLADFARQFPDPSMSEPQTPNAGGNK